MDPKSCSWCGSLSGVNALNSSTFSPDSGLVARWESADTGGLDQLATDTHRRARQAVIGGKTMGTSVETAMHAVLPHSVVLHVHSVNTIAWAVRRDGPSELAARLEGIDWAWIPYDSPPRFSARWREILRRK